jgi:hypothetical protein
MWRINRYTRHSSLWIFNVFEDSPLNQSNSSHQQVIFPCLEHDSPTCSDKGAISMASRDRVELGLTFPARPSERSERKLGSLPSLGWLPQELSSVRHAMGESPDLQTQSLALLASYTRKRRHTMKKLMITLTK